MFPWVPVASSSVAGVLHYSWRLLKIMLNWNQLTSLCSTWCNPWVLGVQCWLVPGWLHWGKPLGGWLHWGRSLGGWLHWGGPWMAGCTGAGPWVAGCTGEGPWVDGCTRASLWVAGYTAGRPLWLLLCWEGCWCARKSLRMLQMSIYHVDFFVQIW